MTDWHDKDKNRCGGQRTTDGNTQSPVAIFTSTADTIEDGNINLRSSVLSRTVLHALSNATGDEKVPGTFCPSESVDEAPASEIREVPGTLFSEQNDNPFVVICNMLSHGVCFDVGFVSTLSH